VTADCLIYALSAFFVLVVLLALMVIALAWGTRPVPARFFAGWRDVFAALRDARSREEKCTVYLLVVGQLANKGGWAVVGVVAAGGFPAVGAICLDIPGIINAVGDNAVKVIDVIRGSRRSP
jgi:hypothetical protein